MTVATESLKESVKNFWDKTPCGGYWTDPHHLQTWIQQTEPYVFEWLSRHGWIGHRVLDAGCGQGTLLPYLSDHGATVYGMDLSSVSLQNAFETSRSAGSSQRIHLLSADVEHLPFTDGAFDAVISIGVLHHTPDTAKALMELHRVLKPGGLALVMLYRRGNPKWWLVCFARWLSGAVDRLQGKHRVIATWLHRRTHVNSKHGTALLELFGCPILKAFSNQQARVLFHDFSHITISNCQPGFRRMADLSPVLAKAEAFLSWLDRKTYRFFGFYQTIEAQK